MPTFRDVRARYQINGFQCHHLIPVRVCNMASFRSFFEKSRTSGFDPDDFRLNGMHLPCREKIAVAFGLPLHRGPHPAYNQMVAERLAAISVLDKCESRLQLMQFLRALREGLRNCPEVDAIDRRNPFQPSVDMRRLDGDADFLFRFTQPS